MGYLNNHKNAFVEMLCFWENDNLLGCSAMLVASPILVFLVVFAWLSGKFGRKAAVYVKGELSVPIEEFKAKLKARHIKFVVYYEYQDVTHIICNNADMIESVKFFAKTHRHVRDAKIVTETEFWKEMDS